MLTEYYIDRNRKLLPSQDFQFLLNEGFKYIERYGSKFWTDYNAHDPGITMLDVLCYAITELGYRADFDIKDVLTNKKGKIENHTFFSAATIFTNAPLTLTDYRKLLIDIEGVSNAWLLPTKTSTDADGYLLPNDSEATIYINKIEDKLSLKNVDKNNKVLQKLPLRGLNKVKIELEENPILGDLNTLLLEFAFWEKNRWVNLKIVPQFTNWNHPDAQLFKKMNKPSKITIDSVKKVQGIVYLIVNRYSKPTDSLHFRIFPGDIAEVDLIVHHFSKEKNVCEVISLFKQKKDKIQEVFSTIAVKLHQNRNFTEDYLCTEIVEKVAIGICADIELQAGADAVEAMTQIQIAIDNIINPKIVFYTLAQLVNEGYHSEDIFLGPKLTHGFLKDIEIEKAQLASEIHASDIIAVLMEISAVKSVRNLMMTAYTELGAPYTNAKNEKWVLKLSGEVKPVFDAQKSKLLLFQKNIPFLLSETQLMLVEQKVILYKSQFNQQKLQNTKNDFEIENGTYFDLNQYYSIQDEFPRNYGLGKNYISEKDTPLRKAQAKQLKGYLYFYEQILADFFSQLYNAKELFNINIDTDKVVENKTYFPVYLEKDDETGNDFYSKELYTDTLKKALLEGESDDDFSLYESKSLFYDRKNRVLDHLLARFSESFNDYVFMMYQLSQKTGGMGSLSFDYEDLIADKQKFIYKYPEISSNRGLGIDYLNATINETTKALEFHPFWNSDHRAGYEKRVAKLLGINEIPLRNIVAEDSPQTQWTVETKPTHFVFKIITPATNLQDKWDWAQLHFLDQNLYKIDNLGANFYLYLVNGTKKIAKLDMKFMSESEAYDYLVHMIKTMNIYYENFYCLEHILLRPFNNNTFLDDDLLTVCLNDDCDDEANNDPYSFKATIVLPGYISRFKNIIFRKYAEKTFRQEAPAHTLLKICWVNADDMLGFQKAYKQWIKNYRYYRINYSQNKLTKVKEAKYRKAVHELILALKELNTLYPEGNLYDCQLSDSINPIILGNTSLGTL
ncbi:hypothetical protein [Flavobacterium cellulosilyticum]|uniref:Uncharacterized protein n=1 Tax=Flavobacterium cellulosilyticum TaxID=2541731 RepID=A0A4R5C9Q7_9FLAO|nr:hypothetical protein [Flavobacterium cellulosilyticum]TDD96005.1 hypothetical protein E0F76_12920 [Flavobacterium cellulosilyticum]